MQITLVQRTIFDLLVPACRCVLVRLIPLEARLEVGLVEFVIRLCGDDATHHLASLHYQCNRQRIRKVLDLCSGPGSGLGCLGNG